jgi:hypothetical protein
MKFNQLNKELNLKESNAYVSTALGTKKGLLSKGIKSSIEKQVQESDLDQKVKDEFLALLDKGKVEQALEMAVRAMTTSKGLRTSQMRAGKNKPE